jgi:hypothetical protein
MHILRITSKWITLSDGDENLGKIDMNILYEGLTIKQCIKKLCPSIDHFDILNIELCDLRIQENRVRDLIKLEDIPCDELIFEYINYNVYDDGYNINYSILPSYIKGLHIICENCSFPLVNLENLPPYLKLLNIIGCEVSNINLLPSSIKEMNFSYVCCRDEYIFEMPSNIDYFIMEGIMDNSYTLNKALYKGDIINLNLELIQNGEKVNRLISVN